MVDAGGKGSDTLLRFPTFVCIVTKNWASGCENLTNPARQICGQSIARALFSISVCD